MDTRLPSMLALAMWILTPTLAPAQESAARPEEEREDPTPILTFESSGPGGLAGWAGGPSGTLFLDSAVVHGGRYAGRIARTPESPGQASAFTTSIPVTFPGDTVELRGWLRTEEVTGFAGLWLRVDGRGGVLEFDNMSQRELRGSTEWTRYSIRLGLGSDARRLVFGGILAGHGAIWIDDLEILVDGGPLVEAPVLVREPAPAELDTEFDEGSPIERLDLSDLQVRNLVLLGKVWGFVKYHHPRVVEGELNWDYELFRVMSAVLEAPDRASAARTMAGWLGGLGEPPPCEPCVELPEDLHLTPEVSWIRDQELLGRELSVRLETIYARRPAAEEQYYVTHNPGVGNPSFSGERAYRELSPPDPGFRLLALYRFWNIIEYWFPYRDVIGEDWDAVLAEFVPKLMEAETREEYRLTMIELSARIHDTHSNLWGDLDLRPPRGDAGLPVEVRFVQGRAVVGGFSHEELGPATGLEPGDVILRLDGRPVDSLVEAWRPWYSASNEPTRLRDMGRSLTRGEAGPVRVAGLRGDEPFELTAERVPLDELDLVGERRHDLPGPTFQRLSDEVAYLKLSTVKADSTVEYVRRARGAQVLVVDIRNYPGEFVVFALGRHLVTEPTPFARFTVGDPSNPGAFLWRGPPVSLQPAEPGFQGKVVILVDEVSQSQAEYTTMALRTAPGAIVVGSTTAGADGNISPIPLPGGATGLISGIGVFYPDRTPTQRVGIVPDLEVRPTIAGIRAGRDEVLEAAVSRALGREWRLPPGR